MTFNPEELLAGVESIISERTSELTMAMQLAEDVLRKQFESATVIEAATIRDTHTITHPFAHIIEQADETVSAEDKLATLRTNVEQAYNSNTPTSASPILHDDSVEPSGVGADIIDFPSILRSANEKVNKDAA